MSDNGSEDEFKLSNTDSHAPKMKFMSCFGNKNHLPRFSTNSLIIGCFEHITTIEIHYLVYGIQMIPNTVRPSFHLRGFEVRARGSRFEVRGSSTRFEVRGSRFEVRGSRTVCKVSLPTHHQNHSQIRMHFSVPLFRSILCTFA